MSPPRFSIVIPTRNRPRTLEYALQTCLAQQFDSYEVVVSDNHSSPETRTVVEACRDRRVRYARTPAPLSMADSFEFALSHATGELVTVLPDDDGLLVHALAVLDRFVRQTGARVIRWDSVLYNWPDIPRQAYAEPNALIVPLRMEQGAHRAARLVAGPMIAAAANGDVAYSDLPLIYCSAIHRDVIAEIRRRTGRVFHSRSPDVYGAFAAAHVAGSYYSIRAPLGIAGTSGHSIGVAYHFGGKDNPIIQEVRSLNDAVGCVIHPWVPELPVLAGSVADAFLYARQALFPSDPALVLDRRRMISACMREAPAANEAESRAVLAACRAAVRDEPALLQWFDATYGMSWFQNRPLVVRRQVHRRYGGTYLSLDAHAFGACDVAGAARLVEKLLGYGQDGMEVRVEQEQAAAVPSLSVLEEKEAVIQELHREATARLAVMGQQGAALQQLRAELKWWKEANAALQAFRDRWSRPVRRGLPHLVGKMIHRLLPPGRDRAA
jgi:hypothetical protein